MGNWVSAEEAPPVVLVPPLFHRPELDARSRMAKSSYDVLFSKLAREHLFVKCYGEKEQFVTTVMLKPPEDPNVDMTVTVSNSLEGGETTPHGAAVFRWQRDATNPNTFVELDMNTYTNILKYRACAFNPQYGLGAFCSLPVILRSRIASKDQYGLGMRYGSSNLSIGTIIDPILRDMSNLWIVGRLGKITAGCQFKPHAFGAQGNSWMEQQLAGLQNPGNWSFAVGYGGSGNDSPLSPSFNVCLEVENNSKFILAYYHHLVVQRKVKNPFEGEKVVAITNYIDVGFEFEQSFESGKSDSMEVRSKLASMQVGGSWQINKNWLLKAKVGILQSGVALMLKSWWQPSFTLSFAVLRDHLQRHTKLGLGLQVENFGGVSYERADPNYIMITPNKQHVAGEMLKNINQRPLLQTDIHAGHYKDVPSEFQPLNSIL